MVIKAKTISIAEISFKYLIIHNIGLMVRNTLRSKQFK